jgi:hypothetical protein
MKIGAENRKKVIAASVLGGLALILVGQALLGSGGMGTAASAPATPPTTATSARPLQTKATGKKTTTKTHSLDPELRYDWLQASEDTKYEGNARNIFQDQVEIPKPVSSGATDKMAKIEPVAPPPPPPPPPINLKFFGFANNRGGPKRIFLAQGEDVFIAAEGDIVDRRYRVVHIAPQSVEIEDMLNNNRQTIPLVQG